jgi:hypothetical protein
MTRLLPSKGGEKRSVRRVGNERETKLEGSGGECVSVVSCVFSLMVCLLDKSVKFGTLEADTVHRFSAMHSPVMSPYGAF